MLDALFYIFAFLTLFPAIVMVVSPNPVNGAFSMILSFVGTAALFVLLDAYFLAAVQVLVYAGAVMVLFIFIIMLLDVEKGEQDLKPFRKLPFAAALMGLALLVVLMATTFLKTGALPEPGLETVAAMPTGETLGIPYTTSAKSFGYSLFTKYLLPMQVCGFLLLAAMLGVIVISKRPKLARAVRDGEGGSA